MVSHYNRFMLCLASCISIGACEVTQKAVATSDQLSFFDRLWLGDSISASEKFYYVRADNQALELLTAQLIENNRGATAQSAAMEEPDWTIDLSFKIPWRGDVASLTDIHQDGVYHVAGSADVFFAYNNGILLPAKNTAQMIKFLTDYHSK